MAQIIGFLKGKSAIWIARLFGRKKTVTGQNFWAKGYYISTTGMDERPSYERISNTRKKRASDWIN